jgi:hypothetical protein
MAHNYNYPAETPKTATLLWDYLVEWRVAVGKVWHGEPETPGRFANHSSGVKNPPKTARYTVTFEVPPLRAAPTGQFLRESLKAAGFKPGDDCGLPSDLDLLNTAGENARLLQQMRSIGDVCTGAFTSDPQTEREALDTIREIVSIVLSSSEAEGSSGSKVLETMRIQQAAIEEKKVDVAAALIAQLD